MNKYHRQPHFASTLLAGVFVLLVLLAASSSYAAAEQQAASQTAPAMAAGITVQVNIPVEPWVNLGEIHSVGSNYQGEAAVVLNAVPLSLASADLDKDGTPDLLAGYAAGQAGWLALYRGQPGSPADRYTVTFEAAPLVFALPAAPDYLATGDFNADGWTDVLAAAYGGQVIYLLPGDGNGDLGNPVALELPGPLSALASGEIGRQDGLADLAVGVSTGSGPQLLVFDGQAGLPDARAASYPLPAPASAIAIGQLDDSYPYDLAIAAGKDLIIFYAHDPLAGDQNARPPLQTIPLAFEPLSLAIGDFITGDGQRLEIALLNPAGGIHLYDREGAALATLPAPAAVTMLRLKTSSLPADDLLLVDAASQQAHILTADGQRMTAEGNYQQAVGAGVLATFEISSAPAAMLPVRLNVDGLDDLVILAEGTPAPLVAPTAPVKTFVVDNPRHYPDRNPGDGKCERTNPSGYSDCTLLAAIQEANASAGADEIQLNISPNWGPGGNTISPDTLFPDVTETVTIRNISANEQRINGSNLPVGIGLHIRTNNSVLDGITFSNFASSTATMPVIKVSVGQDNRIQNCRVGPLNNGVGIELASGNNRIQQSVVSGNSREGVLVSGGDGNTVGPDNYLGFGESGGGYKNSSGVLIKGATNTTVGSPYSGGHNIISGNSFGVWLQATNTTGTLIIGNTIGLNANRTEGRGNLNSGVLIETGAGATTIGNNTTVGRNYIGDNGSGIIIDHAQASAATTTIRGNYIGVNGSASAAIANRNHGIDANSPALVIIRNNIIGGSPTSKNGIRITYAYQTSAAHEITGNTIGTNDANGSLNLGHGQDGISVFYMTGVLISGNHVRYSGQDGIRVGTGLPAINSSSTISDNLITDSARDGLVIDSGHRYTVTDNQVYGNYRHSIWVTSSSNTNTLLDNRIVCDPFSSLSTGILLNGSFHTISGTTEDAVIQNCANGVMMSSSDSDLSGYLIQYINNTGVNVSGFRNVIGPNNVINWGAVGIDVAGKDTVIKSNYLGVDQTGNVAAPNYQANIMDSGEDTTIGGVNPGDGNVISGLGMAGGTGMYLWGTDTTVRNNRIGVGADGVTALGNIAGVHIGGSDITIRDNTIAHNSTGVLVEQGRGNEIIGNSIYNNGMGIDLSPAGVTLNDSGDGDIGANDLQNFPVISNAGITAGSAGTRVMGMLDSLPSKSYTIRLYSNPACDPSGHGQGRTYLGSSTTTTNASGQANIDITVSTAASVGHYLTATATDPDGNTSEFSACFGPLSFLENTFTVNTLGDAVDNNLTDGVCDSSASPGSQCTLRAAIQQANYNPGANTIILPAGTYNLTLAGSDNVAAVGDLDITGDLTLSGAGANVTIIQSQVTDRVFEIRESATVSISGVTIQGGNLTTTANGAGILTNSGTTLSLDAVTVQGNQTTSGSGGGIYSSGTLTILNSALINNSAGGESNGGGGLYVFSGQATLRNSTVSGNQSKGNGGGIQNLLGTVYLQNVTVYNNTADSDNDGGDGGGLYNAGMPFYSKNSIIAENKDLSAGGYPYGIGDCYGSYTSEGYNLVGDRALHNTTSQPACTGFQNNDTVGGFWLLTRYLRYNAGLGPLQLNGGTTPNHSPVAAGVGLTVDTANPSAPGSGGHACEPFDQRGQARPIKGNTTQDPARCDRGAVELIPAYIYINDVTASEGNAAVFNVTLSVPAQITFTVQYSTTDISALAGQDYTHVQGSLTFNLGETSKTISVPTLTDTYNEDTETFRVRLYNPQWVFIADGEGIGSITDGSPQPSLRIDDRTVTEGDEGSTTQVVFTVSLNSASGKTVAVDYATVDGSALAGQDYGATQGTLTFAPGVTSQTISVNIIGDNLKEGNESFTVQLSNPVNATIGDASGTGTITDDDTPAFWIYNANIIEGDSGTSTMNFIVQLLKPSTQAVTVRYSTSPGSAEAGSDYIHTSGTLSFAAGETLQVVSVQIIGDQIDESDETFTVTLSNPSAGTQIGRGAATGTIYDVLGSPFHNIYLPLIVR